MSNRVLLVGGSGGIGKELHLALQNLGYNDVISTSRKELNVLELSSIEAFLAHYKPSTIVNLAAYNYDSSILKLDSNEVDLQIQTNTKGLVNLIQTSALLWRSDILESNSFINISSVLATDSVKGASIYAATKAFADSFIKSSSKELAKYNITYAGIQLGYFDAGLTYKLPKDLLDKVILNNPLNRLGNLLELGQVVDAIIKTPYLNGSIIRLSGGI